MSGPFSLNGGPRPESRDVSASLSGLSWGCSKGDDSRQVLSSRHLLLACASRWRLVTSTRKVEKQDQGPGFSTLWSAPQHGGQRLAFGAQCPWSVPGLAEEQKRELFPKVPFSLVPSPVVVPAISSPRTDSILENIVSPGTGFVFAAGDSVPSLLREPRAPGGPGWRVRAGSPGPCDRLSLPCRSPSRSMGHAGGLPPCVTCPPLSSKERSFSTSSVMMMKLVLTEWHLWIFNSNSQ